MIKNIGSCTNLSLKKLFNGKIASRRMNRSHFSLNFKMNRKTINKNAINMNNYIEYDNVKYNPKYEKLLVNTVISKVRYLTISSSFIATSRLKRTKKKMDTVC